MKNLSATTVAYQDYAPTDEERIKPSGKNFLILVFRSFFRLRENRAENTNFAGLSYIVDTNTNSSQTTLTTSFSHG